MTNITTHDDIEKCQACDEDGWIAGGEDGDPIRCFHDEADTHPRL
jgi:hypothetical protein